PGRSRKRWRLTGRAGGSPRPWWLDGRPPERGGNGFFAAGMRMIAWGRPGNGSKMLSGIENLGAFAISHILPFIFVLTIVVFFHELGHFLVARRVGVKVKTFSVGFGPELLGFTDRKGTRWRLSWIPLGGYVKFLGDENE